MTSLKPATSNTSCSLHEPVKILASAESLAEIKPKTIPEFFHECCQKHRDLPALAFERPLQENGGSAVPTWTTVTYGEYEKNVEQASLALLYLGVQPRTSVSILAVNCPEWFYVQLGALRINAVAAGIYTTNSAEAVFHVLDTSDASVVVVDDILQMSKVRSIRSRLPQLRAVVQLNGPYDIEEADKKEGYYRWSDIFAMQFSSALREELVLRERDVAPNDCALLIFTSGTVGMPKGVMISHDGVLYCSQALARSLPYLKHAHETIVTYLPLNHIAAQLFDIFMGMENGATVYFADRNALKGTLGKTFLKAKPTMLFGVPRIFEKIQEKLMHVDAHSSGLVKCITNMARTTMMQHHLNQMTGRPTSSFKYWWASKITNRIKHALGLDRAKGCFIGGAPVAEELKRFFLSLDLPLTDVYGMSETSGGVIFNFERPNLRTIGKTIGEVEIKIREPDERGEGEIILRGRSNLMGYLKEPEKTRETLTEDGWILTGDVGYLDADGHVYINGRIKELIITTGGENIPPNHIEALIKKELPCLSNAVAIGDHRKYVTALLTFKTNIDADTGYPLDSLLPETIEWLESLGLHYTHLTEMLHTQLPDNLTGFDPNTVEVKLEDKIQIALEAGIKRSNQHALSNAQRVQYFTVLPHDFSIPTNELGPTLKIRRNIVHSKYSKTIDKMYRK